MGYVVKHLYSRQSTHGFDGLKLLTKLGQKRRGNVVQREGFEKIKNVAAIAAQEKFARQNLGEKLSAFMQRQNEELRQRIYPVTRVQTQAQFQGQEWQNPFAAAKAQQAVGIIQLMPHHYRHAKAGFAGQKSIK